MSSKRWFSLRLDRDQVPYMFKPDGGGSQWASTSAELLASLCALHAFGWLDPSSSRRTVALELQAGTDNRANEALSSKRSTTKWPLMLINMQLSASLARARLSLNLKWRPREENVEADQLTNEEFEGFDIACRVDIKSSSGGNLICHWLKRCGRQKFNLMRRGRVQSLTMPRPSQRRRGSTRRHLGDVSV